MSAALYIYMRWVSLLTMYSRAPVYNNGAMMKVGNIAPRPGFLTDNACQSGATTLSMLPDIITISFPACVDLCLRGQCILLDNNSNIHSFNMDIWNTPRGGELAQLVRAWGKWLWGHRYESRSRL